jgi:hypothetical protein
VIEFGGRRGRSAGALSRPRLSAFLCGGHGTADNRESRAAWPTRVFDMLAGCWSESRGASCGEISWMSG